MIVRRRVPQKLRTILASAGAFAAVMAVPAVARAAGTVSGGPVKVAGGYSVMLHAVDAGQDTLTLTIDQGTMARGQTDSLVITKGVRVTVKGASASIKGSLGQRGSVDLRLRSARTLPGKKPPKGCTGSTGTVRGGRLEGSLRLRLPNGKSVMIRSLRGETSIGGALDCRDGDTRPGGDGGDGDGNGDGGEPQLLLSTQAEGATVSFLATKRLLSLTRIAAPKKERGATVSAVTNARASGTNLLSVSGGGAGAAVKSAGAFTGSGTFNSIVGPGPMATGPLTGSLQVKLQGTSVISIVGDNAMLMHGDKG